MKKIIIIILVITSVIITYFISDNIRLNKILETKKNNYSEVIKTIDKIKLYDKNYKEIGSIDKNTIIYLEKQNYKLDYYKLKGENYYIYYENIKKDNAKTTINYLPFNLKLITKDKFKLENITINESKEFNIYYKDKNYFIKFNNKLYEIDNKYVKEIREEKIGDYIDSISILILKKYTEEQLEILSKYKTITLEQYKLWKENKIVLDNSILLISEDNELFKKYNLIVNKKELEFELNDEVSTRENLNSYEVDDINNELLNKMLNKEKIEHIVYQEPIYQSGQGIPVLNYHFFYSPEQTNCRETICLNSNKFEEHLKYLKDNNFKTLTMQEFVDWYDGKIEVPEKSVLITVDDGAQGTSFINGNQLIPLLEKYDLNATLFLITAWWDINNYQSKNLDVESHGYDIHKVGTCGTHNINCLSYNELYDDLKKSFDIVNSYKSFCYPFYVKNNNAINILSDLGVRVAFGGGNIKATRNSYRYYIPRYPIYDSITLDQFINIVN